VNENLVIKWQLTKVEIPISDIIEVTSDDTYGGEDKTAIRIGHPYGTTDRIVVKTKAETYILFTSVGVIKDRIVSYMNG
jgi:hypothetical protein